MVRVSRLTLPALLACGVALAPVGASAARLVYINTDPVTIVMGGDDPTMDSFNVMAETDMDGWTGATEEQIATMVWYLKQTTVDYDIEFVRERPAMGPYDMVVYGGADDSMTAAGQCTTQYGPVDCGNASPSMAFMFWGCLEMDDQLDPERVAFHTLGSLGYGWGMENVAGVGQVMSGWSATALQYGENCSMIDGASMCTHDGCAMGTQNGSADMLARHGARVDDGPPVLTVLSPAPGSEVTAPFDVSIEVEDAFGGVTTTLAVGANVAPDDVYPYLWSAIDLPDGPVTLVATAIDADGNEVTMDIPICVGGPCENSDSGDGDGDTETSGDDSGDEGDTGDDSGVTTVGADDGDRDGGKCSTTGNAGGGGAVLMLLGLAGLRRRRD